MTEDLNALFQRANALFTAGRFEEALPIYEGLLESVPDVADVHLNHATTLKALGRLTEAEKGFHRAIGLNPGFAGAYFNLGNLLRERERYEEAEMYFRKALEIDPENADFLNNLGATLMNLQKPEQALEVYSRASNLQQPTPEQDFRHAEAMEQAGLLDRAAERYQLVLDARPVFPEAANNLGNALIKLGRYAEAEASFRTAIEHAPDRAELYGNLATSLYEQGRYEEALQLFDRSLGLNPDDAGVVMKRAMLLLLLGRWQEGFEAYESRWHYKGHNRIRKPDFRCPLWDGGSLAGKTLLLHAEQGFGDAIQMARYASLLATNGVDVIVRCQGGLARLFGSLKGVQTVIAEGNTLPDFDTHAPMMSLPRLMGTTPETVPDEVPYLFVEETLRKKWQKRLKGRGRKIGLVWQGNPAHERDHGRSLPVSCLEPLMALPNVSLFSLQIPARPDDLDRLGGRVEDLGPDIEDFADTAAAIESLDLVISVDTSVAHLAGALGRPVWIILPFAPDWRWGASGTSSPWYPHARIYRQVNPGKWSGIFSNIVEHIENMG